MKNNNITKIEHYDTNIISTPIQTDILTYNNNELIAEIDKYIYKSIPKLKYINVVKLKK